MSQLLQVDCDTSPTASVSSTSSLQQDTLTLTQLQNLLYEQYGKVTGGCFMLAVLHM